ncbi:MAG TPA: hypothetical protein ENG48_13475 [Candidatus Atribacteria bacterium]|nr:hypothetical protein [Candidatus Atribacteria bacterium]
MIYLQIMTVESDKILKKGKSMVMKSIIRFLIGSILLIWIYTSGVRTSIDWVLIIIIAMAMLLELRRLLRHEKD